MPGELHDRLLGETARTDSGDETTPSRESGRAEPDGTAVGIVFGFYLVAGLVAASAFAVAFWLFPAQGR